MSKLSDRRIEQLALSAVDACGRAYAPYSQFEVGAAILMQDGQVIAGCNVENASYGLSICAERAAAAAAVSAGYRKWRGVAIASVGGVPPCGACRQFLAEFGIDTPIILVNLIDGARSVCNLSELLPRSFDAGDLPEPA
ncbi:MAG: cytidine deaminase [Rubripirellula sp.]|nr:cytidine deaminase [Rhodopirellula sp.]MCH1440216.1 cytidine deaminase [Rubripirellula sp.]OUX05553.1 MAG: cytidine deaminase [Planctomycetaceae bacterium TMED240]